MNPLFATFGARHMATFANRGQCAAQLLFAACRPCSHRVCLTAHECATATTVDEVLRCAEDLLPEPAHA